VGIPRHPAFCCEGILPDETLELCGSTERPDDEAPENERTPAEREDVINEENRVHAMLDAAADDLSEISDSIVVHQLRKVYPAANGNPPKVANKTVTMAVKHGECMGMLGPNGAGKTTCINMLCGFQVPALLYSSLLILKS